MDRLSVALRGAPETILLRRRSRWERVHSQLEALSPKAILARGYALVFDADGRLVKQARNSSRATKSAPLVGRASSRLRSSR